MTEELFNQRELVVVKLKSHHKKLSDAVQSRNERVINKTKSQMAELLRDFEQLHTQYVTKKKGRMSDIEHQQEYLVVEKIAVESEALVDRFEEETKERELADEKQGFIDKFNSDVERVFAGLNHLTVDIELFDPAVLSDEITFLEREFYAASGHHKNLFNIETNPARVAEERERLRVKEHEVRKLILKIKHDKGISVSSQGNPSSRSGSPGRSAVLRTKRMEFPTFDGNLRNYITFRRDFREVVEAPGDFSAQQMAQILRNECLKNTPKLLVANVYDYEDIWKRLDESYHDPNEVVGMVTKELRSVRHIDESDYTAFIDFVDKIERAHLDLSALGETRVLDHPVTVEMILEKTPEWVRKAAAAKLSTSETPDLNEFATVLALLVEKRREARRLLRWAKPDDRKKQQQFPVKQSKTPNARALVAQEQSASDGHGAASSYVKGSQDKDYVCMTPGCKYRVRHILPSCNAFKKLPAEERGKLVMSKKLCVLCLNAGHAQNSCPKKSTWKPCDIGDCGRWHSRMLHGAVVSGVALVADAAAEISGSSPLLLVQEIPLQTGHICATLWDTGSSVSLVTFEFARRAGLCGVSCHLRLGGVGGHGSVLETELFSLDLVDKAGSVHRVLAFGLEEITSPIPALEVPNIGELFPDHASAQVNRGQCAVDLLIGMQEANIQPVRISSVGKLSLFESMFGSGYVLGGASADAPTSVAPEARSLLIRKGMDGDTMDFLTVENMGVDIPRRCRTCNNCKDCNFKAHQLTWRENQELEAIEAGLELDTVNRVWTARYPFIQDPSALRDNFGQAVSCMRSLETRLTKNSQLAAFNEQFQDALDRGVFRELSKEEAGAYSGPVNYVSMVDAYKSGPHVTTPVRLCINSSLKNGKVSLNDILVKGPSSLNDIFSVMLGFRRYKVGILIDISKFYQTVLSCQRDQHVRRVVWRFGDNTAEPRIFLTTRVNFGDRPAGCVAQAALRETARLYSHLSPTATEKLLRDSYVDDLVTGAELLSDADVLVDEMSRIVQMGGFLFKEKVVSGARLQDGQVRKVLGTCWDHELDVISVDVHVNYSEKCKGVRKFADVPLNELSGADVTLTKRKIWRATMAQFDLLGLAAVFLIRLKLVMRELSTQEGRAIGWDEEVPQVVADKFRVLLGELPALKNLSFPRSVVPDFAGHQDEPILVAFGDGSQQASCAVVYICWRRPGGGHFCRLVAAKTRVAPLQKISVPRVELLGALLATRLVCKVQEVLGFTVRERVMLTDSTAVLGMIKGESSAMREFVGTRVGEIKTKTQVQKEWYWVPTAENVADLGTRDTTSPADMGPESVYQKGTSWMQLDRENWPLEQVVGAVPLEEMVHTGTVAVVRAEVEVFNFQRFRSWSLLVGTLMSVCAWRWKRVTGRPCVEFFNAENRALVISTVLAVVQEQERLRDRLQEFESLRPREEKVPGIFTPVNLIVVSGRLSGALSVGYDSEFLPLLPGNSVVARLVIGHAHGQDHSGTDRTVQRSREVVWITQARKLAKSAASHCFTCKKVNKKLQQQIMAPLPQHRVKPAPVFSSCAVDLFGPIKIRDAVKRRVTGDSFGVIFVCTHTSAVHLDVAESYSTDSFLLCLRRFVCLRGMPSRLQSDPGTQLVAAAQEVRSWARENCVEWQVIPADAQHYNGCAEAMIRCTKRQLTRVAGSSVFTFAELTTLLAEIAQILNSRPLVRSVNEDVLAGGAITPNHLILGRASIKVPEVELEGKVSLTRRLRFVKEVKDDFWRKWLMQVFPNLVPSYRWKRQKRDVVVGDVVLLKDASLVSKKFKLAIVTETKQGLDGRVRSLKVMYRIDGRSESVVVERSVHNVVVVVPVDWKPEDAEDAVREDVSLLHHTALGGV